LKVKNCGCTFIVSSKLVEELVIRRLHSLPLAFVRAGNRIIDTVRRADGPSSKYELFFYAVTKLAPFPDDFFWSLITGFF
jgi:hypothetical protein